MISFPVDNNFLLEQHDLYIGKAATYGTKAVRELLIASSILNSGRQ
jgi:hypothetical protein